MKKYFLFKYSSYSAVLCGSSFIISINLFKKEEPPTVVNNTMTKTKEVTNYLFSDSTCKHNANAITPLIIPANHVTFNYLGFK